MAAIARARATRHWQSEGVEESVEVCVSNRRSGRGLRGGWFVPFSSGSAFALSNDRAKNPPPAPPRPKGICARSVPLFVPARSLPLRARRRGVWGCVRVSPTPLSFLYPRPRASAREVPTRWLNCRCTPASAPFGSPSARGYLGRGAAALALKCAVRLPNDGSAAFPLAALALCLARPNGGSWDSHPRARLGCAFLLPKVALALPSGAGRGLKVCSSCRRCVVGASLRLPYFRFAPITRFQRIPREVGGDAGGEAAQNRARRFGAKRVCPESAALGFPRGALRPLRFARALDLRSARLPSESPRCGSSTAHFGGRRPLSNEVGATSRTTNRPRGLRLFSRRLGLNEDAAGTLRAGRENRSPVRWGRVGTLTVARVDDGRGAVGV